MLEDAFRQKAEGLVQNPPVSVLDMGAAQSITERLIAPADGPASSVDSDATPGADRASAETELPGLKAQLEDLQERMWAEGTSSLLLVLQGMDTSGKGGSSSMWFQR